MSNFFKEVNKMYENFKLEYKKFNNELESLKKYLIFIKKKKILKVLLIMYQNILKNLIM